MIDWSSLHFLRTWPAWLALAAFVVFALTWLYRRNSVFPDLSLAIGTRSAGGVMDRLPLASGVALLLLLTIAMMAPAVVRIEAVDQRARDFVILVDTSRSMRHDTAVRRSEIKLNFERRVGTFSTTVDDPSTLPFVARFELARESLLRFVNGRGAQDRIALVYFNDDAHPVSALTTNFQFVIDQLAAMDEYVNYGTDIAAALDSSLNLLDRYPDENKRTVILLTDAETSYTDGLEEQLGRLAESNLSFYLLWITADEDQSNEELAAFLKLAGTIGNVVSIQDPDSENLMNALLDVGRMEAYSYKEVQRRLVDLTPLTMDVARVALLIWLLLMVTVYHPGLGENNFMRNPRDI